MKNRRYDRNNSMRWGCAFLVLCILYVMAVSAYAQKYAIKTDWDGNGTRWNPYLIQSAEDFKTLYERMREGNDFKDTFFRQTTDLDFNEIKINNMDFDNHRIGNTGKFAGVYDGGGHTMRNISEKMTNGAVFGDLSGRIMNLGLDNKDVYSISNGNARTNGNSAAASEATLVWRLSEDGFIINCWNTENAGAAGSTAYAGLVQEYRGGKMFNCWSANERLQTVLKWQCKMRTWEFNIFFYRVWEKIAL